MSFTSLAIVKRRQRSESSPVSFITTYPSLPSVDVSYSNRYRLDWEDTQEGVATSGWHQLIKDGVSLTTPYERKSFAILRDDYSPLRHIARFYLWDYANNTHVLQRTETTQSNLIGSVYFDSVYYKDVFTNVDEQTDVTNEAYAKFRAKIFDARNKVLMGTYAKEWRETLELVRKPASALIRLLGTSFVRKAKRKLRRTTQKHRSKVLADLWLEYKFGWKPLVSDLEGAITTVSQWKDGLRSFERVTGTAQKSYPSVYYNHPMSGDYGLQTVGFRARTTSRRTKYGGLVMTDRSARDVTTIPKGLGLTLEAFVPTVWELIPYSFLIDYFTNVGDLLKAWAVAGVTLEYAFKDVIRDTREAYSGQPPITSDSFPLYASGSHHEWSGTRCWEARYRYFVRSDARNEVGAPQLSISMSFPGLSHGLNMAALLSSRYAHHA